MTGPITYLFIAGLVAGLIYSYLKYQSLKSHVKDERNRNLNSEKDRSNQLIRMMERLGLNEHEQTEWLVETHTTEIAESDKWEVELTYGKWVDFGATEAGSVPSRIRGFWHNSPARFIGVLMPAGSWYDWHKHKYMEILLGVEGVVIVHLRLDPSDPTKITIREMGPGEIIEIPPGVEHFVPKQSTESEFMCVWIYKNKQHGFRDNN